MCSSVQGVHRNLAVRMGGRGYGYDVQVFLKHLLVIGKNIRNLIKNNCITTVGDKGWTTYIIKVKYNKKIIKLFQDNFKKVLKDTPEIVKEKNGLYEKDKLRWIKLQNLKKNMGIFRPWYKKFVKQILYQFE